MAGKWYVYMLRCAKGALYTGMTNDVNRRVSEHNSGKGAKCLKALGLPVRVAYVEECMSKRSALEREREIKTLTKVEKERLVLRGKTKKIAMIDDVAFPNT